jgi:hypothetical protein
MATKSHRHSRRPGRIGRFQKKFADNWLLVLLARTLASIVVALVARWLHLPT